MKMPLLPLERVRFECSREILCPYCQSELDRHQPDEARPDQLLGTCLGCGMWYLVDGEACVMYGMPDVADLRTG